MIRRTRLGNLRKGNAICGLSSMMVWVGAGSEAGGVAVCVILVKRVGGY